MRKSRTDIRPQKFNEMWVVYYISGKWGRLKAKLFKTKKWAYKFFNSLPLE